MNVAAALLAVLLAAGLPIPAPKPEAGAIGIALRGRPELAPHSPAVQVYFVRVEEGTDIFASASLIPSNFTRSKQVYLLNCEPGRYVAVAARMRGAPGPQSGRYLVMFEKSFIERTAVEVKAGEIAFVGSYTIRQDSTIDDADEAQAHYLRVLDPRAAERGYAARAFTGSYVSLGTLQSGSREPSVETEFWRKAASTVFTREKAWGDRVKARLAARR